MKNKWIFYLFVLIAVGLSVFGVIYVVNSMSTETHSFSSDGYALYSDNKDTKPASYSFTNGTDYSYKKLKNNITFTSTDGNVAIDESTFIHYANKSYMPLKNVVGLDLSTIDSKIIFYYNIYKNTIIKTESDKLTINTQSDEKISFNNMLIRINDNKYLLIGDNVRATLVTEEIIDFGNYVYFEYVDGSVIKIYNNTKSYKTIAKGTKIIVGDNTIDLNKKTISKKNKEYITLSNLVIDNDGNIDIIVDDTVEKLPDINKPNADINNGGTIGGGTNGGTTGGNTVVDDNNQNDDNNTTQEPTEEEEDPLKKITQPTFKVTEMVLTPIKLDAKIEITDEDNILTSATSVTVVENSTSKVVYEQEAAMGDTNILLSVGNLSPDTEYTIYCKADYEIEGIEYNKTFLSKIFRSQALGVSFTKSYATNESLGIKVSKDNYSKVSSVTITIYNSKGEKLDYQAVNLSDESIQEVIFTGLDSNSTYSIIMSEILVDGLVVSNGYSERASFKTLKQAPTIEKLEYEIDKRNQTFNLKATGVNDSDYGIEKYRYEIYDARSDLEKDDPILVTTSDNTDIVKVKVDDIKLNRGTAYTYKLVLEFNDNEKIVEYTKNLGTTMQLDGVEFPTVRWEKTNVTWEQINGTIIVDDPSGAIVSDNFKVVYKNSLGIHSSRTITASTDSDSIPININNLRANETYTFEVFADVNMQDDNEQVDEMYIGSVFVQTEKPKNLIANYSLSNDYLTAFGINMILTNPSEGEASLEASTISEMTLTLYQGTGTSGTKEVAKKVVDLNEDDYKSTIKELFYDQSTTLNPTYFDSKNSDYTQKTYTLKVSNVYDYTDYKNEITIINDEYTFPINSYIPDTPTDPDNAIIVTKVLNKNAEVFGLEYDNNLEPNTIVGYNLVTDYLNESGNATRLVYHVWKYDPTTKEYVKLDNLDRVVTFNEEGLVNPELFEIGYGTPNNVDDTDMLRRGNKYRFSYEVYLDIDGDGTEDGVYPTIVDENMVLRSKELVANKESSKFQVYPSTSTSNTATWKYKYVDVDSSLANNKLYSFVGNSVNPSSNADISVSDDYQAITLTKLTTKQFYTIKKQEQLIKGENITYENLTSQYFYGINGSLNITYSTEIDSNKLIVSIDDYYDKTDITDLIVSADVKIIPTSSADATRIGEKTLTNLTFDSGNINIDLFDIAEYLSVEFKTEVTIYIDTGNTGFDVPSAFKAIQKGSISAGANYFYIGDDGKLAQNSIISGSEFETDFDTKNYLLKITNKSNKSLDLNVSIDETGVVYSNGNIVLKELSAQKLNSDSNITKYDLIIPSIKMLTGSNKLNILALLNTAEISPKISVLDSINIKDNLIYMDLYSTDENGVNAKFMKTVSDTVTNFNKKITLTGLSPKTNYYVQFYTYVYNVSTSSYEKYYLYDNDYKISGYSYRFYTLSDVGVKNIKVDFQKDSYTDKKLKFDYTLDNIQGYDYIAYEIYELIDEEYQKVNVEIPNSVAFFTNMSFTVDATPGNEAGFAYGKKYRLDISPIGHYTDDEGTKELDLGKTSFVFTLDDFEEPYIGISSGKTSDTIYFRVSIDDVSKVVKDDLYTVKLMDSNYNVIATINDISTNSINKKFTFSKDEYNLKENDVYIFMVMVDADYKNKKSDYTNINQTKSIRFGDSVNLGSVTANKNANNQYALDIIFADSYKLGTIDKISYTVSSTSVSYFATGNTDFITRYEPNTDLYYYTMELTQSETFAPGNVYTITMNFYSNSNLVAQEEINYYYGGA